MLANCKIVRDNENRIQVVQTPQGQESQTFNSLAQLPFNTVEQALEDYKQVLNFSEVNVPVIFRVGDSTFVSYKEALTTSDNKDIEVGVLDNKGTFQTIKTISSNTNPSTRVGFLNNAIKNNLIEDKNYVENGVSYLQGYGYSDNRQLSSETVLSEFGRLNSKYLKVHVDGRISILNEDNLERQTFPDLAEKIGVDKAFIETVTRGVYDNIIGRQKTNPNFFSSEETLKEQILSLLNKAGFQITSIDNYQAQYNLRNGEMPNAEALIDLANQVVAFKDGTITLENLSEEFVHFVTGSMDLSQALEEIPNTEEYNRYSEEYRQIYSQIEGITEDEVETLVRKEVLDKLISQELINRTQRNQNLFQSIWQQILEFFNALPQTNLSNEVSVLTDKVSDLLLSQDITNLQNLQTRRFRMYKTANASTPSLTKEQNQVRILLEGLRQQEIVLRNRGANVNALNTLLTKIEKAYVRSDIASAIDLALRQVEYIEQAIQQSQATQEPLSSEERLVASNLKKAILPLLNKIAPFVENKGVKDSLDLATIRIAKLDFSTSPEILDRLIERIMSNSNLPDSVDLNGVQTDTRDYLRKALEQADKDTNIMFSFLGQATHAKDPVLNLLGKLISDMHNSVHQSWFDSAKTFTNQLESLGMRPGDLNQFYDKDGYIMSYQDWEKFDAAKKEIEAEVYSTYFNKPIEEVKKNIEEGIKLEGDTDVEYQRQLASAKRQITENIFTEQFYIDRDNSLKNLPEVVQNKLRQIALDRSQLMKTVEYLDGVPVFTKQDRLNLDAINLDRKRASNPFSLDTGNLKQGLSFAQESDEGAIPSGGYFITIDESIADDEALIAYHLSKSNQEFAKKMKEGGVNINSGLTPKFFEQLNKIESEKGREAAINFLKANVNFGLGDELFQGEFEDIIDKTFKNNVQYRDKYQAYKELVSKRKNILKQFQDPKNATNILADKMTPETMEIIRELTRDISTKKQELFKLGNIENQPFEEGKTRAETNSAFKGMLKDNDAETDLDRRLSLTMKHVNIQSLNSLYSLFQSLDMLSYSDKIPNFTQRQLERAFNNTLKFQDIKNLVKGVDGREQIMRMKIQLAEQRLAPYYKTFQPTGLIGFEQQLENSTESVSSLTKGLSNMSDVKLTLHQSYYEISNEEYENLNYNKQFKAFREQPKLGDLTVTLPSGKQLNYNFKNTRFNLNTEGNVNELDDYGVPMNLSNDKKSQAYKLMLEFQYQNLVLQKEEIKHNLYKAPQFSKTLTERLRTLSGAGLKEGFKELITFRADEQVQGAENDKGESILATTGVRVVPKRYIRDLENSSDVSEDLFHSVMLMRKESELYVERQRALGTVMALEEALLTRSRTDSKSNEASNTMRMFNHFVNSNIFGNTEVQNFRVDLPIIGTVDVAKVLKSLHRFLRFKNLGFKLSIPMTSWITAEINLILEKHIGQYIDKGSMRLARKVLMKYSNEALSESLNVNKTSHISLLGEYMDSFQLETSYRNSQYQKATRFAGKASHILHTAGNYTPLTTSFLSFMIGRRAYGGNFVSYNTFKEQYKKQNPNASTKDVDAEWNLLENKSYYSYLSTATKKVEVDYNRMQADLNYQGTPEEFKAHYRQLRNNIMAESKKFVERIDGAIAPEERTYLQNHFLGQYTMTHKGWMAIAIQNRFKSGHTNLNSGIQEEGSYMTLARKTKELVNSTFGALRNKEFGDLYKNFKNLYVNASETERYNLQRIAKDFGVMSALYLLMLGLRGFADDDDNQDLWALQYTTYLSERVLNETKSSQFGLVGEMANSMKEPIVGFDNILNTLNVLTLFDTEEYKSGKYQGLTKAQGYLYDNFPGAKEIYLNRSGAAVSGQRARYEYHNNPEDWNLLSFLLSVEDSKAIFE